MAKDEGLHSPKAIAFIRSKNTRFSIILREKNYSTIGASCIEKAADFLQTRKSVVNRLNIKLMEKIGDLKWTN